MAQLFRQMTVCGVGLIGGSLALIARRAGVVGKVVGLGRSQANLDVAVDRGMIDIATRDPIEAARGADLIVLAVPIQTMRATLEKMIEFTAPDAVVTDVGSVKQYVVRELEPLDHWQEIAGRGASCRGQGDYRRGCCRPCSVSGSARDSHAVGEEHARCDQQD